MSPFRIVSVAFSLTLAACGGESQKAGGDGSGGPGATGGSAAGGTGAGGTSAGGTSAGGTGAAVGSLSGDYWIEVSPSETYYLTVTSPTEALIGRPFEPPAGYRIEYHPGAPLGPAMAYGLSDVEMSGEYVLSPIADDSNLSANSYRYALERSADVTSARRAVRTLPCHVSSPTWTVYEATATRDTTPTLVRAEPEWGVAPPWGWLNAFAERPIAAPLAAALEVKADGAPVAVTWSDAPSGLGIGVGATIDDWPSFLGRTLELSGSVTATNGVPSPVLLSFDVLDFGMHTGPVALTGSIPSDVAAWGNPYVYAAGTFGNCPNGCASIGPGSGIGMRFIRPGASLRVTSTFRDLEMAFMTPGGTPTRAETPPGDGATLITADIPVPTGADDLFVTFQGPYPVNRRYCESGSLGGYLASVEPSGTP
jgi:hypothetical protein